MGTTSFAVRRNFNNIAIDIHFSSVIELWIVAFLPQKCRFSAAFPPHFCRFSAAFPPHFCRISAACGCGTFAADMRHFCGTFATVAVSLSCIFQRIDRISSTFSLLNDCVAEIQGGHDSLVMASDPEKVLKKGKPIFSVIDYVDGIWHCELFGSVILDTPEGGETRIQCCVKIAEDGSVTCELV